MSKSSPVEDSIKHCIEKNGFPVKSVRLPFKAIHDSCKKHNTAVKEVLANLLPDKITGTIQGDFIEFRSSDKPASKPKATSQDSGSSGIPGMGNLPDMDSLKDMAQSYMSQMNPEQIEEMKSKVANMSEEERKDILKNFSQQFFKGKP
ncbi:MAG TPA: hypothetical protein QGF86_04560 [Nitrospinaceae bacterium]|nr:hypothetical protein [Nitrospinaceae bacterium]